MLTITVNADKTQIDQSCDDERLIWELWCRKQQQVRGKRDTSRNASSMEDMSTLCVSSLTASMDLRLMLEVLAALRLFGKL